ncbi:MULTISPECIES: sigma-54-dependent Fis family transcriptional regulator [unclassified Desulfovibrio]|uniref:sigma-54-dependent Fis family transcriptional regulator n=1 Tax=unclassified Desulfovibrio TaxID=2593640 RepID=UPI000F5F0567|nr:MULTISPECIES: sigma 54-interacting transcriptional regulator [unclassified Desulfovibrio]RRD69118.1 sigma-54-dependent Fis family transcriptional regulator [Desulfovibrio sp. OH1209_COT-279]RRD85461.1 sigma-54-dependent Fis family transcriptional regulator [Desulfovibrio sp. OH1186_COT-070]
MFGAIKLSKRIEKIIQKSHERSRRYGIDPHCDGAPPSLRLSSNALKERIAMQNDFFLLAKVQMDSLFRLLHGTGFCMLLADREGYILYMVCDKNLQKHFNERRCLPGFRWTEHDVGTCAIGLVLVEKIPIFLPGHKMYSTPARKISNAAAPIFSPSGELIGVFALSCDATIMHINTMGLMQQASETITSQLKEQERLREVSIKNQYLFSLIESDTRAIVTIDSTGHVVKTNQKARNLLHLSDNCSGHLFDDCLGSKKSVGATLIAGQPAKAREAIEKYVGNKHYASISPIQIETGELGGWLITIMKKKEIMRIAVEMAGNTARFTFDSIIGTSQKMKDVLHMAHIAARSSAPLLITGETGTGKELFAQAIHNASDRRDRPFIAINCGAIPKELLESELFGYEEGAFTGAQKGGRIGKFEMADTGTLFLDEIGDMPFDMQVKMLRVLQTNEIQRVGGLRTTSVNLRIISATNKNLQQQIADQLFRSDLFYRISTLSITIPSLRSRREDILPLALHFIRRYDNYKKTTIDSLPQQTREMLNRYDWPGNIRQLENVIERAIYLAEGTNLKPEHFGITDILSVILPQALPDTKSTLKEVEKATIVKALKNYSGNISKVASFLGISRPTLYRKLHLYGLDKNAFGS